MRVEFELTNEMKVQAARTLTLSEILNVAIELSVVENKQELLPLIIEALEKSKSN